MLPGMTRRPRIAIVGAGNLGTALAVSLRRAGYAIDAVIARPGGASLRKARKLASESGARLTTARTAADLAGLRADVVWFCVPDGEIRSAAQNLAAKVLWNKSEWKKKIALHSSGALTSDELDAFRRRGAAAASVHPMMTFVPGSRPALSGVPFAIEGDAAAARVARRIVGDLGGECYAIRKADKAAYHAWGTFASPLLTALLATTERVAALAGIERKAARKRIVPILLQTLANYATRDAAEAFSGPIIRGDVETVKRHLRVLRKVPAAREVYVALARSALRDLPAKNKKALRRALGAG
jgi:predicted short-subunit dehydrogenase-like oxidoreductase (DUF2520 family)